jgi:hypothetical protein
VRSIRCPIGHVGETASGDGDGADGSVRACVRACMGMQGPVARGGKGAEQLPSVRESQSILFQLITPFLVGMSIMYVY